VTWDNRFRSCYFQLPAGRKSTLSNSLDEEPTALRVNASVNV
jgi:hypothetical protein